LAQISNNDIQDPYNLKFKAIKQFIHGIESESEFYLIAKNASKPLIDFKSDKDPRVNYYKTCESENTVAIPALSKIKDKVLHLNGYTLGAGLCKSLGNAFLLSSDVIEKLVLEATGTNDEMFADILKGLIE
jgi:hypothetical protein